MIGEQSFHKEDVEGESTRKVLPKESESRGIPETTHDVEKQIHNDDEMEEESDGEEFSTRWAFILAAIGSAIGLGNFWRFPYLAFRWGGGAFFVPYLIALFFVGIPLMQLEMALGHVVRKAATQAFGALDYRWRGVGLGAATISFIITGYYSAVIGWGNVYFVQSFYSPMPWSIYGVNGTDVLAGPTGHFFGSVLQLSSSPLESKLISSSVFAGALFLWASVFVILWKGAAFISKAVWLTVLLPVVMLFILLFVGLSLEGSGEGIKQYIGAWDMSLLKEGDMWVDAFTQIFFSLSLSTGVMTAYASMNPKSSNIVQDAIIVSCSNCLFSFVAGFAVFSIAGYMSHESGMGFDDPNFNSKLAGPKLAFIAYPSGLSLVGGAAANFLNVLFFLTFYFLGVDSAFSLVESVVMNFREVGGLSDIPKTQMTAIVCFFGFLTSILYCSDIGLYVLDVVDDYSNGLGLLVVGFFECFSAGWVYNHGAVTESVGSTAHWVFNIGVGGGFTMFAILVISLGYNDSLSQGAVYGISFGVGLVMIIAGIIGSALLGSAKAGSPTRALYYVALHGPESLRAKLNEAIVEHRPNNWKLSIVWSILLKYVMSPLLLFLFILRLAKRISTNGYASTDYGWQYQLIGGLVLAIIFLVIAVGWFVPHWYADKRGRVYKI